jgi:predicted DNA-binding helix-hairpin-helix protein
MNFKVAPEPYQKLELMGNATRFEPAGSDPLCEEPERTGNGRPKPLPCISDVSTPAGRRPILKAMVTTACERNCNYCPFRAGRSKSHRITFQPEEMAGIFLQLERAGLVQGLFLSSGIIKGGASTQDKLIDTAEILRRKQGYRGYLHLKIMPGAEPEQVRRTMQLADRVSVNLEGATPERLGLLAPKKDYWSELVRPLQWIARIREEQNSRTSVATQFVVGAVGDTDLELLSVSEGLYNQMGLRRVYYSTFAPVDQTPFESLPAVDPLRGFRLYQASFLLRDYGWDVEDLPFDAEQNLPLHVDPKLAWAKDHLVNSPVEINEAERCELLRVPGIGPVAADVILEERRRAKLTSFGDLRAIGIRSVERVSPYVLLDGRRPAQQLQLFGQA